MYPNLEVEMFKRKMCRKILAERCGICESALRNKIKGRSDFTLSEVEVLLDTFSGCEWSYLFARENETGKVELEVNYIE